MVNSIKGIKNLKDRQVVNMITVENGLFLLLQAFSSGVAGYITNKYAVNMIFKEFY